MTMVIVVDEEGAHDALASARKASHEHPARVIGLILGSARGKPAVNAQIGIGDGWSGEVALIRLYGEVVKHAESVVLPLLLPDSPVVVWWSNDHPDDPAADPIGRLAQRRITDAAAVRTREDEGGPPALRGLRAGHHRPGLDPAHAVARPARGGARPAAAQGQVGDRSPPSGSARAPTCSPPGWPTGSR